MDGFDFYNLENLNESYSSDLISDDYSYPLGNYASELNKISIFNNCSATDLSKEPEPEKYSKEELEEIKKESIIYYTGKRGFSFFALDSLNKENDVEVTNPLEDMEIFEDHNISFRIGTDPYDIGRRLYNSASVIIIPNQINSLIGCNGAGKSTMLTMIKESVEHNHFCLLKYDNLRDGGSNALDAMAFSNNFEGLSFGLTSSEGENICNNVFNFLSPVEAVLKGNVKRDSSYRKYRDIEHIFVTLDAVDSGFSIDNIINLKAYIKKLIALAIENNKKLYVIVAANSFEFAVNTRSWDVQKSREIYYTENDYVKYRKRVVETRQRILDQWDRQNKKLEKKKESSGE